MHTPEAKLDSLYSVGFLKDRMRLKLFNILEEMKRTNQPMSNKLDKWHSDLVDKITEFDSSIILTFVYSNFCHTFIFISFLYLFLH